MTVVLDHTIVPVNDREQSVEFCQSDDFRSIHYAFAMEPGEFDEAFQRIKDSKITYGDSPFAQGNMQGPGITLGAKGDGKAVYFKDPSGHVLEIKTY